MAGKMMSIDGNFAAAHVAYAFSDVAAIYPITPSSTMGEYADTWASMGQKNVFGRELNVVEMQSEAGAAGAVHGSLSAGALTTTFTASQGLLLMIPNMYKIAGEMLPTVFHVSARSLAAQSLSIFGDHSDVMSVRQTGFALMAASSIQETMDLALVSHLATLEASVPFLNFFDGFRTSHEIQKVEMIDYSTMGELLDMKQIEKFRARAMRPENHPVKVGAQNPDVYFQGRETVNKYYDAVPGIVQKWMDKVGEKIGRSYKLFDYVGAPDAETVLIAMGSSCETIQETINYLVAQGRKVGAVVVHLYRPFAADAFVSAIPATAKRIGVLDRTKEPGSLGEPLYLDVCAALKGKDVAITGGRYGLSSKEFTPTMVAAIYDHIDKGGWHGFTVGINDDVTNLSIPLGEEIDTEPAGTSRCMFWGLGSDGTVGANKNSIKIIGDNTDMYAQGYFSYDSKKSGGITISHLRFGKSKIQSPYLITKPDFVACHNPAYVGRYDMLKGIAEGGVFLLNSEHPASEIFATLTRDMQQTIIDKKIKFYCVDALKIAEQVGLGGRINTVMQTAFFALSNIMPQDEAIKLIKKAAEKSFAKKGMDIVKMNWDAIDASVAAIETVEIPASLDGVECYVPPKLVADDASDFAKNIILPLMHLKGDDVPVSQMSFDGVIPSGTSCLEKRGIAPRVPHWLADNCIQCNQCVMACPHAVVRAKQIAEADLAGAPETFVAVDNKSKKDADLKYKLQVYIEDCTGCGVCIKTCPKEALVFSTLEAERALGERKNAEFFDALPDNVLGTANPGTVKGSQFLKPLFEFSGACAGCGETPYVKLVTQLFGERMVIANATGCSSIYGGTFPTIPYTTTKEGYGPSWGNSLFEDNAEYGMGMRLAVDSNRALLKEAVAKSLECELSAELKGALETCMSLWDSKGADAIAAQRAVRPLLEKAVACSGGCACAKCHLEKVLELADYFIDKSVWIFGGDGWAYDIGYGGLDHALASGKNINVLVMDTEVYSNTGGQASKATPIGAVAKFANAGMRMGKKNMGLMMMSYGHIYVASIAMGANRNQTLKAFQEAEAYDGPSIILAYAPCINHGIDMMCSQDEMKRAVEAGYYPLYRYNPEAEVGKKLAFESKDPNGAFQEFIKSERRYTSLYKTAPSEADGLFQAAEEDAMKRFNLMKAMGDIL
jgi:pyruvate-ferredoxin/flavodoxin oxidoreductase